MRAGEQDGIEQPFRFLLIGGDDRGAGLDAARKSFAVGIEQRFDTFLFGAGDELRVEIRGDAGGQAAAEHQPGGVGQLRFDGSFNVRQLAAFEARAQLVELHGQSVTIDDGEVEPDVVADGYGGDGESAFEHVVFEAGAAIAAGGKDCEGFSAEGVDDGGGVDAAAAGGVFAGENVGAIVESEAVHGDRTIDRKSTRLNSSHLG